MKRKNIEKGLAVSVIFLLMLVTVPLCISNSSTKPIEPKVKYLFLCTINISGEGQAGLAGPFFVWRANGHVSITSILGGKYEYTGESGGFLLFFKGDWTVDPLSIQGFALVCVVYPL